MQCFWQVQHISNWEFIHELKCYLLLYLQQWYLTKLQKQNAQRTCLYVQYITCVRKRLMFLSVVILGWVPVCKRCTKSDNYSTSQLFRWIFKASRASTEVLNYLDSVLLSRKAECIPSHRMQNIEAFHALEPWQNVSCCVSKGMPNMQASSTAHNIFRERKIV
jgi:hypothetical protein